jgi:hypothetical protein
VLQVEEEARRVRAGAGKLGGTRGGLGGGGATWSSEERASARWGAAARVLGRHVAQRKAAREQQVLGAWPARAAGHRCGQKQSRRTGGRRRGTNL